MKQKLFITFGIWILLTVPTLANGTTIDEIYGASFGETVAGFGQYTGQEITDTVGPPSNSWTLTVVSRVFFDAAAKDAAHLNGTFYYFYQLSHTLPMDDALNQFVLYDLDLFFDTVALFVPYNNYLAGGPNVVNPMAIPIAQEGLIGGIPIGLIFNVDILNSPGPVVAALWIASGNGAIAGEYAFKGADGVATELGSAYLPGDVGGGFSFNVNVPEPSSFAFLVFALIAGSVVGCRMRTGTDESRT